MTACPVNCIHPAPGEPGFAEAEMVFIDADTCVGCGACVTACPVGAIVPDTAVTAEQAPFVDLAAEYYDVFPHADRTPVALVPTQRRLASPGPYRVAIVGAGPAGLYAADELLKHPEVSVDVFDRLPVPHGLARFGVAPDHEQTRAVSDLFRVVAEQPGFSYRLGVEVGPSGKHSVSVEQLEDDYDAVVWATGAPRDRRLGVPGEDLPGVLSAVDLVGWFNGHPERRDLDPPLDARRAVVVGMGNVALDAARLLATRPDSAVEEVVVLARRGPADAAFTTPELIGLAGLDDVDVVLDGTPPVGTDVRSRLLADLAGRTPRGDRPRIALRFRAETERVLGEDHANGVRLADGREIAAGLVVRAVGQDWTPIAHDRGRVRPGVYVVGWAKRGPTGFIGTNKSCAEETVDALLDELDAESARSAGTQRLQHHPERVGAA